MPKKHSIFKKLDITESESGGTSTLSDWQRHCKKDAKSYLIKLTQEQLTELLASQNDEGSR